MSRGTFFFNLYMNTENQLKTHREELPINYENDIQVSSYLVIMVIAEQLLRKTWKSQKEELQTAGTRVYCRNIPCVNQ